MTDLCQVSPGLLAQMKSSLNGVANVALPRIVVSVICGHQLQHFMYPLEGAVVMEAETVCCD